MVDLMDNVTVRVNAVSRFHRRWLVRFVEDNGAADVVLVKPASFTFKAKTSEHACKLLVEMRYRFPVSYWDGWTGEPVLDKQGAAT